MSRNTLVIFVKAPEVGRVKTRLARDIGAVGAALLYRRLTRRLLREVGDDPRWRTVLAVSPDGYARKGAFWPLRYRRVAQGAGDLGLRMMRQVARHGGGPVVIVGSDIPGISRRHIAAAFRALAAHDAVVGPAEDGGYWLIGFRHRRAAPRHLDGVRWSSPDALADTLARLGPGRSLAVVDRLRDVDTLADVIALGLSVPGA